MIKKKKEEEEYYVLESGGKSDNKNTRHKKLTEMVKLADKDAKIATITIFKDTDRKTKIGKRF